MILIVRADGRLLLIRRGAGVPRPGYWSFPSGRIEAGETPAQTVRREGKEELDVELEPVAEVWQSETDDGRVRLRWWLARLPSTATPRPASAEVAALAWIRPEELTQFTPHFPEHVEVLRRIGKQLLPP